MSSLSVSTRGTRIESHRDSVILNAGPYAPEVSLNLFFGALLPKTKLTEAQVAEICKRVLDDPTVYNRKQKRWVAFPKLTSADQKKISEDVMFAGMIPIAEAIENAARACAPEVEQHTTFSSCPADAPESTYWANKTRPDAELIRLEGRAQQGASRHWMDLGATGEYKKYGNGNKKAMNDDIRKALWNLHQTMREDARRRFAYSFTIERFHTRIWFASRSEVLVSHHFDFMARPELLIRMFLSFFYGSPEELGWDPTMELRWDGDVPQYDITVQPFAEEGKDAEGPKPRIFRTEELLSSVGAEHLRGRGTRVWKVRELVEGKPSEETYVLKDTWIDSDRMREGYIMAEIKNSATNKEKELIEDALLTTEIHGDVYVDGKVDRTLDGDARASLLNVHKPRFNFKQETPKAASQSPSDSDAKSGSTKSKTTSPQTQATTRPVGDHRDPVVTEKPLQPIYYHSKTHYRIVFKEVCRPLYQVTSLKSILWMLMKASAALTFIHRLGWVHRDISSGNLLLYDTTNSIKIADWEYAKKMDRSGTVHDIRTGTEDFMAVEVSKQKYLFANLEGLTANNPESYLNVEDIAQMAEEELDDDLIEPEQQPKVQNDYTRVWNYNPLHDMESIFWLCVFYVLFRDIYYVPLEGCPKDSALNFDEEEEPRTKRIHAHYAFGRTLFAARGGRWFTLSNNDLFEHLRQFPLHPIIARFDRLLLALRSALVRKYEEVERSEDPITHNCANGVHTVFVNELRRAIVYIRRTNCDIMVRSLQSEVELLKLHATGSSKSSKRSRSSREDGGDDDDDDSVSHPSKTSRVRINQSPHGSPSASTLPTIAHPVRAPKRKPVKRAAPPPTRVLRSHIRAPKAAEAEPLPPPPKVPSPPAPRPARKKKSAKEPPAKTTKNRPVAKAVAKAANVKNRSRKGR